MAGFYEIVEFRDDALDQLLIALDTMVKHHFSTPGGIESMRFAIDGGGLRMKINDRPWTPALGEMY